MEPGVNKKFWAEGDFYVLVVLTLIGLVFFLMTWSYTRSAALFPRAVALIVFILSLYSLLGRLKSWTRGEGKKKTTQDVKATGMPWYVSFLAMLVYFVLIDVVGFIAATFLFLILLPLAMGYKKFFVITVVAVVFAAAISYSFGTFLHVPLPEGMIFQIFS